MADYDLDSALELAKTSAASTGQAMGVFRYLDVEQGYAVAASPPNDRPVNWVCQINSDGREYWS